MNKDKEILRLNKKIKELEKEINDIPKQDILDILESDYQCAADYYDECLLCCNPDSGLSDQEKSMWEYEKHRAIYHNYVKVFKWLGYDNIM